MISGAKKYFIQPFEMSDNVRNKTLEKPSIEMLEECAKIVSTAVDFVQIRGIK